MNKMLALLMLVLAGLALPAVAQDAKGMFAVVKQIQGSADNFMVVMPNGAAGTVAENERYPEGTEITTGDDETLVLELEGEIDGAPVAQALIAIKPTSQIMLDKMFVSANSATTRMAIMNGEVRAKITTERADLATDMKVSTPTTTASVTGTDVHAIGYNANFGSYVQVATGSIAAANANGQVRSVSGGTGLGDGDSGVLGNALNASSSLTAPFGSVTYEVTAGQLTFAGAQRAGSDANNPATNPSGNRRATAAERAGFNPGETLPSRQGRGNRR